MDWPPCFSKTGANQKWILFTPEHGMKQFVPQPATAGWEIVPKIELRRDGEWEFSPDAQGAKLIWARTSRGHLS